MYLKIINIPADYTDNRRKKISEDQRYLREKNKYPGDYADSRRKRSAGERIDMTENDISYKIRGAIFNVFNNLGPGLLESVYVMALRYELLKENLTVRMEVPVPVYYENEKLELGFRLDLLVGDKVIIEVKSVENLAAVHHKQVLTYLKLTN